jgi:O-antigen ligase
MMDAPRLEKQRTQGIKIRFQPTGGWVARQVAKLSQQITAGLRHAIALHCSWLKRAYPRATRHSQPAFSINIVATSRQTDWISAIAVVGLVMLGIVAYGLDRTDLSTVADVCWGIVLLVACRVVGLRRTLARFTTLRVATGLFVALILWVLLSMSPWSPAGHLSAWSSVGGRAGTLDRSATLIETSRLLGLGATFVVGLALGSSDRRTEMVLRSICIAGATYSLLALALHVLDPTLTVRAAQTGFENRLTATFFSPNVAAALFGILGALMLSSISVSDRTLTKTPEQDVSIVMQYGMLVLFMACLVLTASRMGTAGAVAGMMFAAALHYFGLRLHSQKWRFLAPQVLGLGIFTAFAIAGQVLIARFWTIGANGNGRKALYETHWQAFLHRPLSGYGLGSFTPLNHQLMTPATFSDLWGVRASHSVFLQWLEEGGLIGASLMFSIIGLILFEIFRGQSQRQTSRWAMRGILGASVVLMVDGTADFALQTPAVATLWALLLGVGYAAATGGHRADAKMPRTADAPPVRIHWWGPVGLALMVELLGLTVLWANGRPAIDQRFPVALRTAQLEKARDLLEHPLQTSSAAEIRRLARSALMQSPLDAYAWMTLAHVDLGSPEGLAAFRQSYRAAPFDPNLFKWRTSYAANHWNDLSGNDRAAVLQDMSVERHQFWELREWLSDLGYAHKGEAFALATQMLTSTDDPAWPETSPPSPVPSSGP